MSEHDGLIERMRERAAAAEAARLAIDRANVTPLRSAKTRKGEHSREDRWAAVAAFRRALDAAYPGGFWETVGDGYQRLDRGEPDAVQMAVLFLEADPWFYRSGYVKQALIRRLKRLPLATRTAARLRAVVLAAVDGRDRREFRRYCHLARAVDAPELRAALAERLLSADSGVRRRAEWMLAAIEGRPVDPATEIARRGWRDREALARAEARGRHQPPVRMIRP